MGIMITYGSYVKDDVDLNKANNQIEIFDTGVAFLAGLMIIPAVYVFLGDVYKRQALNVARSSGQAVAVFSLEMSREQLVTRILSNQATVENQRLVTGNLREQDWVNIANAASVLSGPVSYTHLRSGSLA